MDASQLAVQKQELRERLTELTSKLAQFLAGQYSVDPKKPRKYGEWLSSHEPFQWFAEFYGIMPGRGFDGVVVNPPYVEYRKVLDTYRIEPMHFETENASNLYAFCVERSGSLLRQGGRLQ